MLSCAGLSSEGRYSAREVYFLASSPPAHRTGYNQSMAQIETQVETQDGEDRLGMTDAQWAQWQAFTQGYGEQDANGIDVSNLRANLRLSPTERLIKHQRALKLFKEVRNAGIRAACPETGTSGAGFCC